MSVNVANSVKLYSNGSAVITKGVVLTEGKATKVTIPVKKADLDDVVSSLSVFGDVNMPDPPNYTPTNSNPSTLSLDASNVLKDLAIKLRGSKVEITDSSDKKVVGVLFGIQTFQQETEGSVFDRFRILIGTKNGIRQFEEQNIVSLQFTDEFVQSEIDKALAASFDAIKPDSRNVDLTIVPKKGTTYAAVAYATPCAAWKTRYQLRIWSDSDIATLERQAIVDNDTDDDWKDVTLSVITGEPISFSTDIAEIRRPSRSRVNVVSNSTAGAVSAEDAIYAGARGEKGPQGPQGSAKTFMSGGAPRMASIQRASSGTEACSFDACSFDSVPENAVMPVASIEAADVRESGDFSVFTAPNPVTVLSRKSAIIGLGNMDLDDAKTVLLYKPNINERRPYTAIKFTNTTINSLSKGVCEVYVDGDRQGKCVLENTKQGEQSFLIHAIETGVKTFREVLPTESRRIRLKISDGLAYCEQLSSQETRYRIQSSKGESFQFEIEHARSWNGSKLEVTVEQGQQTSVDTPTGCRISTTLPANGTLVVSVKEILVQQQQFAVNSWWIQSNLVTINHPLARNNGVKSILEMAQSLEDIQIKIREVERECSTLLEQERLIALIPNFHLEQANRSKTELSDAETQIKTLKKSTLPDLRKELKTAEANLNASVSKLKADWSDDAAPIDEGQGHDQK